MFRFHCVWTSLSFVFACAVSFASEPSASDDIMIVFVGDSTVTGAMSSRDQAGWGWALQQMAKPGVTVENTAVGGRSSRSFRSEGRWDEAMAYHPDWVLIQFGHNDQKGKGPKRESKPETEYRDHLRQYIAEARAQGAQVILLTPISRRTFAKDGSLRDSLAPYAESVRIVGEETGTPVLDLHARSAQEYLAMGEESTDRMGPPDKAVDKTHFSKGGAQQVALWVYDLLSEASPELASHFDPAIASAQNKPPFFQISSPGEGQAGVKTIPGPFEETIGTIASGGAVNIAESLKAPTAIEAGTLCFWFYVEQSYHSAPDNAQWKETLVSSPKVMDVTVGLWPQFWGLFLNWRGPNSLGGYMRIQTPSIQGPGWHHLAVVWDTSKGIQNFYFDGRPSGASLPTYEPGQAALLFKEIQATLLPNIGLFDIRLYDTMLSEQEINALLSVLYSGQSDRILGAEDLGQMSLEGKKLKLVYEDTFTNDSKANEWVMEGPGHTEYSSEGLLMESTEPESKGGHIVYWLDKKLPDNFVAEWKVKVLSEYGLNIVFFSATGPEGVSIFDKSVAPRDGDFKQYHSGDIDCYHISYYADGEEHPGRSTANLRKNSGFYLVSNGPEGIPPESYDWHQVTLKKEGNSVQLAVDGKLSIDWEDDGTSYGPVLGAGWFGLRQMRWTKALYQDLKIYSIDEK